jgi:hypothetical protein
MDKLIRPLPAAPFLLKKMPPPDSSPALLIDSEERSVFLSFRDSEAARGIKTKGKPL